MDQSPRGVKTAIVILGILAAAAIIAAAFILARSDNAEPVVTLPTTGGVVTVTVPADVAPSDVGGPVGTDLDRALFLDLADLPAGQEEAGLAAAKRWCAEVTNTDGRIDNHGSVFEQYPELDGYSGEALIFAAVTVFCPQLTDHLPTGR